MVVTNFLSSWLLTHHCSIFTFYRRATTACNVVQGACIDRWLLPRDGERFRAKCSSFVSHFKEWSRVGKLIDHVLTDYGVGNVVRCRAKSGLKFKLKVWIRIWSWNVKSSDSDFRSQHWLEIGHCDLFINYSTINVLIISLWRTSYKL